MMPISQNILQESLQTHFPDAEVTCKDLAGDDNHWEVTITDKSFEGKPRIQQHKMVQKALSEHNIHALSIKTETPK
jgi:stress-induced morphogen